MPKDTQKRGLFELVDELLKDTLPKSEFLKAFQQVIDFVKQADEKTTAAITAITDELTKRAETLKTSNAADFENHKTEANAFVSQALTRLDDAMKRLDERVASVKDGKDADQTEIVQAVLAEIKLPEQKEIILDTPEDIRNKLEVLPEDGKLAIEAIAGLRKELDELKKQKSLGGGTMGLSVGHWPLHEAFTMNGSDTTVTLSAGVGAAGTALIVRYQGQTLDLGSQYTVSGNKITFVGFIPEADTIISVTYWQ